MPILSGRIGKWILALSEFELRFESSKAVKGQVLANFVTHHCGPEIHLVELTPWTLFFDGSSCGAGSGIGIVLISPRGASFEFSFRIDKEATNNQAEYRAVLKGVKLLKEIKADAIEIFGDSLLVVKQLMGEYECNDDILRIYHDECLQLLKEFRLVKIEHIPKCHNGEANRLAQGASGYHPIREISSLEIEESNWRKGIYEYLKDSSKKVERKIRIQAVKYVILEDDLYYRTIDGVLLKCVGSEEANVLMGEIHEGVCGAHQSAFKMKWMIRRNGYFWPTILEDCFKYYKGCQDC
ncbi:ribonuclease HI family protein [Robertmurraya kyonggiensis]|uniref:Ribonuclease HI family protein n=1 Tax=Robertmurraya kyonggiensis TaxID=1037680 RepID=A0A4U1CWZ0_9BACI|nr:ribonuclease HI family protein [Robertmurraya kyonggiensis]